MLALQLIPVDGITIQLGGNVWTFGLNFLMYLIGAAVVGFVGAIIVALLGAWLRDIGYHHQWDW
ncbi:MAG TPA: hypothetical protein VFB12_01695 [Ktedonobacteraceae bacterium]|nr:hypothetical protein [Ktedonobacteraceae bacterium]